MKIAAVTHCSKGEGRYILEWAAWLSILGVSSFYIFEHNNDRTEEFQEARFILEQQDIAEFHEAIRTNQTANIQMDSMQRAAELCKRDGIDWLITLDMDEYPMVHHHDNLIHLVSSLPESVSLLYLNWRLYGSSGLIKEDRHKTHFEKFTHHALDHHLDQRVGKAIIRVRDLISMDLHIHKVKGHSVNGRLEKFDQSTHIHGSHLPHYEVGCINHYAVRSLEEFKNKQARGYMDNWHGDFPIDYWIKRDRNEVKGPCLYSFADLIRERIWKWKMGLWSLNALTVPVYPNRRPRKCYLT